MTFIGHARARSVLANGLGRAAMIAAGAILCAADPGTGWTIPPLGHGPEPVWDATMTINAKLLSETSPVPLAREMQADCLAALTTRCGYVDRRDKDPLAAARGMSEAVGAACATAGGGYDAPVDVARIAALFPRPPATHPNARLTVSDHACRVGDTVSGLRLATYDYPAPPGSMTPLEALGLRRSPGREVTAMYVFKTYEVAHHADERAQVDAFKAKVDARIGANECARRQEAAIKEGAMTNAGLLVEKRERVALVQPAQGSAVWRPIAALRLARPIEC